MSAKVAGRNRGAALAAWGDGMPDWVGVLADECDQVGQVHAARRVGFSTSTINEVVRRKYKGRIANIEAAVRGAFMGSTVQCPVLDEITVDLCIENQKRPFSAANPIRVALHRTCPTCPHNRNNRPSKPTSQPEE